MATPTVQAADPARTHSIVTSTAPSDNQPATSKPPYPPLQGPDGISRALSPEVVALALNLTADAGGWETDDQELARGLGDQEAFGSAVKEHLFNLNNDPAAETPEEVKFERSDSLACAIFAHKFLRIGFYLGAAFLRNGGSIAIVRNVPIQGPQQTDAEAASDDLWGELHHARQRPEGGAL